MLLDELLGPLLDDVAFVEHHYLICHIKRLVVIMSDEYGSNADFLDDLFQTLPERLPHSGVQRCEWLVQQQQPWVGGESAGDGDALGLASAELAGIPLPNVTQLHQIEQLLNPGCLINGQLARPDGVPHVLCHGHVVEQRVCLEHEADPAVLNFRVGHIRIPKKHAASGGLLQPSHYPQERCFPRTRGAEKGCDSTFGHLQRHIVKCPHILPSLIDEELPNVPHRYRCPGNPQRRGRCRFLLVRSCAIRPRGGSRLCIDSLHCLNRRLVIQRSLPHKGGPPPRLLRCWGPLVGAMLGG
mmetsp:Transcript_767/g.2349  ORF Transcript_767/g.2349 Transcript_767/m.2349 type:complete len:298 (+) Transcript_767:932-1825(+)